jgi:hypothetical protein
MQNGFDLPSRLNSRKGASNPSDARQKKQRAPLHRCRQRKEAYHRNPRTSHGREEAGVEGGHGEAATRLSGRHASEQRTETRTAQKKRENTLATAPLSLPLAATAGRQGREKQDKENPKQRRL